MASPDIKSFTLPWKRNRSQSPGAQEEPLPDHVRNARISVAAEERGLFERLADPDHPSSGLHKEAVYFRDHDFTATVSELAEGIGKPEGYVLALATKMRGVLKITGANGETPNFLQTVSP